MSKTEQQRADELDAFLTAKLTGQKLPVSDDLPVAESKLAAELVDLAAEMTPDPAFLAELEAKMARSAGRAITDQPSLKKTKRPERLTFWQEFTMFARSLTMKRTVLALGTVAAVFVFAFFAWTAFNNAGQEEDVQVADSTTPIIEDTVVTEDTSVTDSSGVGDVGDSGDVEAPTDPTELALLPRMEAVQSGGPASAGRGGGGGGPEAAPAEADAMIESLTMIAPDFSQIFTDATFVLNTTLPAEPTSAIVQQRIFTEQLEVADARRVADQFGFTGPIYMEVFDYAPRPMPAVEPLPEPAPEGEGEAEAAELPPRQDLEPVEFEPPKLYYAFDGQRILNINDSGVTYFDRSVQMEYGEEVPNAMPIAEAFLQERGMLNFPYVLKEGFSSGEIMVHRVVEGRTLDEPDMFVQVNVDGKIAFASNHYYFSTLETLGNYPLITAEAAWQMIIDDVIGNNISFNIMPDFEGRPAGGLAEPPMEEMPSFWHREYQPGMEAHLFTYPMVYQVAEGDGPPRIDTGEFLINGSEEDLRGIAEQQGQNVHIWGQVSADGTAIDLAGWEPFGSNEPIFREGGVIQRTADQVLFSSAEGETFILLDVPADVPDGLKVNLFGWALRDVGLAHPVIEWQNIDEWFDYSNEVSIMPLPEPAVIEDDFTDPWKFAEITVNEVGMTYLPVFDYEGFDKRARPPMYLQPAWEFSGVTDNGDNIQFRVQAVDPTFVQTP